MIEITYALSIEPQHGGDTLYELKDIKIQNVELELQKLIQAYQLIDGLSTYVYPEITIVNKRDEYTQFLVIIAKHITGLQYNDIDYTQDLAVFNKTDEFCEISKELDTILTLLRKYDFQPVDYRISRL